MMARVTQWFYQFLYRSYRQSSGLGHYVSQRVTPVAWFLIGLCLASLVMGGNLGRSAVILLSMFVLGVLLVAFAWAFFRKAKVSASRFLPAHAVVGEELRYRVRIQNDGKKTLSDLSILEVSDDPRPSFWEFSHLKEPGEKNRNFFDRIFAFYRWKWLLTRGGQWKNSGPSQAINLASGDSHKSMLSVRPLRRGVMTLDDLRVILPDPFGLFQRCRIASCQADEVLVLPKRYALPSFHFSGKSESDLSGDGFSSQRGEGEDFLGLRDYRHGDPIRKIHWKSWARNGEPMVKLHEENRFSRYGLILDANLNHSGAEIFEECVSVAASFISTMEEGRWLLDLLFVQNEPEVYRASQGHQLMEALARVKASDESDYKQVEGLVQRHVKELSAVVVVLSGWDEEREGFIKSLLRMGLPLHVYAVLPERRNLEGPQEIHALYWREVEKDLVASL